MFNSKIRFLTPNSNTWCSPAEYGPLFFIVFMNDLPLHVNLSLDMYADDSTLGASGKTIEDLEVKLNPDMTKVNKWFKDNKMAITCDKTKVMLIKTYQKEVKLDSTHLSVICNNTELMWILTNCWVLSLTKTSPGNFILIRQPNLSPQYFPFKKNTPAPLNLNYFL